MLFDKNFEKDNCGYGLICNRNGKPSRKVVEKSIDALSSMAHRGGVGFDGKTGDGSGLLFDINKEFYKKIIKSELSIALPEEFAIGCFFSKKELKEKLQSDLKKIFRSENLRVVCFRNVPIDTSVLGEEAKDTLPDIFHVFLEQKDNSSDLGPVLNWNPQTGSLQLSQNATQKLLASLGGHVTQRRDTGLTVFFPISDAN